MGLPVWRAPSPDARDARKPDDLSAPARSPIRRRSPFASRRARPAASPRPSRRPDIDFLVSAHRPESYSQQRASSRRSLAPPAAPELFHIAPAYIPAGGARDRDSGSSRTAEDNDNMSRRRREYYYRSLFGSDLPPDAPVSGHRHLPALTPNFAPAAASRSGRPDRTSDRERRSSIRHRTPYLRVSARSRSPWGDVPAGRDENFVIIEDGEDDDSSDSNAVIFPTLRRTGRRTIADGPLPSSSLRESWSPATTLDGLGDRERSLSPIDDHWDTMLTTVMPDRLAPSADSSFTSAAASASFSHSHPSSRAGSSNSNSAASSHTHLTIPSRRHSPPSELFMRACDTSDDDTASDTEEEDLDLRPSNALHRRATRYNADAPSSGNPMRYWRRVEDRAREAIRNGYGPTLQEPGASLDRPISDQLDGPAENTLETEYGQELRDARAILERLAQREDIGDDWASFGLVRPFAERPQPRER